MPSRKSDRADQARARTRTRARRLDRRARGISRRLDLPDRNGACIYGAEGRERKKKTRGGEIFIPSDTLGHTFPVCQEFDASRAIPRNKDRNFRIAAGALRALHAQTKLMQISHSIQRAPGRAIVSFLPFFFILVFRSGRELSGARFEVSPLFSSLIFFSPSDGYPG